MDFDRIRNKNSIHAQLFFEQEKELEDGVEFFWKTNHSIVHVKVNRMVYFLLRVLIRFHQENGLLL